jgi:hypothetical protein
VLEDYPFLGMNHANKLAMPIGVQLIVLGVMLAKI